MAPISRDDFIKRIQTVAFKSFIVNEFIDAAHFFQEIHTSMPLLQERGIKELARAFSDEGRSVEEYWEARQGLDGRFQYSMPRVLYWSYLIFLCGLMETKLRAIASILASHKGISLEEWLDPPKPAKKPDGSYIEKYRYFIAKNSNLDISLIAEWSFLGDLACIRNCLVHRGGQLPAKIERRQQIRNISGRSADSIRAEPDWDHPRAKLIITEYFCQQATVKLHEFFDNLYSKLADGSIIPVLVYQHIY
ncbi:MAG: hypothetical protein JNM83_20850 [Myxococcales bacterium]|nr:hypothetical protein [Myxococcales bacterium]